MAKYGIAYDGNFRFSILETRNFNTDKDEMIRKEAEFFWNDRFCDGALASGFQRGTILNKQSIDSASV